MMKEHSQPIISALVFIIFALVLLMLPALNAAAEISFNCNLYNSEDSVSADLQGDNLRFSAYAELNPDSIYYSGGGSSTEPDCSYSYTITNNGKELASGAKTNSGELMFQSQVISNYNGEGGKAFDLSLKNLVANGVLNSHYSNPDLSVEKATDLNMAIYAENARMGTDQMQSLGSGVTLVFDDAEAENEAVTSGNGNDAAENSGSGQNSVTKGITQTVSVESRGRNNVIETNLHGDVDAVWMDGVMAKGSDYYLASAITGVSRSTQDEMEMLGKSTGFPTQRLPPGEIDLSFKEIGDEDFSKDEIEKLLKDFQEEQDRFNEELQLNSNTALWYYLNQKATVNLGNDDPTDDPDISLAGRYFNMHMRFGVDG